MRLPALLCCLACVSVPPAVARGAEVSLAVEGTTRYDDNVLTTNQGQQGDVSLRGGPDVTLRSDHGARFSYELRYRPFFEHFFSLKNIDDWNHYVRGQLEYRVTGATRISLDEQFQLAPTLEARNDVLIQEPGAPGQPETVLGRNTTTLNDLSLGVHHSFSPRVVSEIGLSNSLYFPSGDDAADLSTTAGHSDLRYVLSKRSVIGFGIGLTNQAFSKTDLQESSTTRYYRSYGIWQYQFSPTWTLSVQAGPALVQPEDRKIDTAPVSDVLLYPSLPRASSSLIDVTTCPTDGGQPLLAPECEPFDQTFLEQIGFTGGTPTPEQAAARLATADRTTISSLDASVPASSSSITYFSTASLEKRWRHWDAALSYERSASTATSFATGTVVDTLTARSGWRPTERWSFFFTASLSMQQAASNQPFRVPVLAPLEAGVDDDLLDAGVPATAAKQVGYKIQRIDDSTKILISSLYLRAERQLTKRSMAFANFFVTHQQTKSKLGGSFADYDDFRFELGFRYEWEPIHL